MQFFLDRLRLPLLARTIWQYLALRETPKTRQQYLPLSCFPRRCIYQVSTEQYTDGSNSTSFNIFWSTELYFIQTSSVKVSTQRTQPSGLSKLIEFTLTDFGRCAPRLSRDATRQEERAQ